MRLTFMRLVAYIGLAALLWETAQAASEPEDELKAAIVLSFLRYSEWPAPGSGDPRLTVGVLGRPAMLQTMRLVLENKAVNERPIRVVEVKAGGDPRCCQLLFLASQKPREIRQALAGVEAARILTIGESGQFLDLGGAVNLLIVDGRMTFEVSLEALERCGIVTSSRLLRFGVIRGGSKGRTGG